LLYSSIVGYDRHAIISLGRGISIYGGLFRSLLSQLMINCIKSLFKIGLSAHALCVLVCRTAELFRYNTSQGLLIAFIFVLDTKLSDLARILEEILFLFISKYYYTTFVYCGAPQEEEGLILNLNSNRKYASPVKGGPSGQDNFNCKEGVVADANFPSTVKKSDGKLNPGFVTGFCDAEACFSLAFFKNKARKFGFRTRAVFSIGLHVRDKALLEQIQIFFGGVGRINAANSVLVQYRIFTTKELEVVIKHFESYPLITHK
jgi:hypothetical protein